VLALALLAAAPVSLLMFFAELGVRPDVMTAMHNPFFDLKFAVTLALASAAIIASLHLSGPRRPCALWLAVRDPGRAARRRHRRRDAAAARLPMMTRLVGHNSKVCMTAIPLMSLRSWWPR